MSTPELITKLQEIHSLAKHTRTLDMMRRRGIDYDEVMAVDTIGSRWPAETEPGRTAAYRRWYALRRQLDIHTRNPWLAFQQRERKLQGVIKPSGRKLKPSASPPPPNLMNKIKLPNGWCAWCKRTCDCQ